MAVDWDDTRLPDVYVTARELPAESVATWREAIRELLPPSAEIRRVIDLGCGTGRFSALVAELYSAPVIGVDPSLRMLAHREVPAASRCRFVAGSAEAIPLATGSTDLVFLSMVYHHLRSVPQALDEMRRVLREGGHVLVRNPTRESHEEGLEYLRCFPEAMALERRRMPSRQALTQVFLDGRFSSVSHRIVYHRFASSHADLLRKISLRGLSSLEAIPDDAFARGLRNLAQYCREQERGEPIDEPVELFVFRR